MKSLNSQVVKSLLLLHSLGIAITIATFVFDILTPAGVAAAVPYALLVLLSLRSPGYALTWFAAASATVLTIFGHLLSTPDGEGWQEFLNRGLALVVIWVTAYLCFAQKRKAAQLQRDQLALIQSEKMASLGEMAAGIAHELGNPLATIHGWVRMLERRAGRGRLEAEEVGRISQTMGELTDRMIRIIRGMRSFARDASSDPFQNTSIARVIRDLLEFSQEKFKSLEIEVMVGDVDEALQIPCRETQISQVLVNLLNNAADAVRDLPERWIRIDVSEVDSAIELSVTDSGKGIPEELREKVMAPFFTTKGVGKGTGLGLSISRSIVENHSGSLWVDEQSPHTRFVVSLPKVQPRPV